MGFVHLWKFIGGYEAELKLTLTLSKRHVMDSKIISYFKKEQKSCRKLLQQILFKWQNRLLSMRD